jgi:GTP-binding protein
VGKSTLFNRISNENRSIISEIPGTTRDAIDVIVTYENIKYLFIDTAGMRKKNKIIDSVEYYSIVRTINSVKKSDLVILMLNAEEGLWEQDLKIANTILEYNKGIIITINKWDLVDKDDKTYKKFLDYIYDNARFINFAPVIFISALTGKRVNKIFDLINNVYNNKIKRIKTSELNDFLLNLKVNKNVPVLKNGVKPKMKFMNQIDKKFPSFMLYINRPDLVDISFKKFIINRIREKFDFTGVPIELRFKKY